MENNELEKVGSRIIEIRGQQVILANDVAALYGTTTREVNKAIRNNPDKFPEGYCFTLQASEKQYVVENFHHLQKLKYSPVLPQAFTIRAGMLPYFNREMIAFYLLFWFSIYLMTVFCDIFPTLSQ